MNDRKRMAIPDCQDILHELKDWQFLLRCLDDSLGDAYSDADCDEAREVITQLSTLLRAYDVDRAVESLNKAIALLDDARRVKEKD